MEEIENILTPKQEAFCRYYTQNSDLFANGVLCYAKAYGYDLETADKTNQLDENNQEIKGSSEYAKQHLVCRVNASKMLTNANIIDRITKMLNETLTDEVIDARLAEIIIKGHDADSLRAISEYNKLRQRITDKIDLTSKGEAVGGFQFIRNEDEENNSTDNKTNEETTTSVGQA